MANRTRGARGGSNLNRTLNESPRHRLASLGNPKKKNVPCFSDFRGGGFFLKRKGHFSFWGSARKDIRAVWRGFNSDSVLQKLFSGEKDLAKPRLILFLYFVRAAEGSGEESARASEFFWRIAFQILLKFCECLRNISASKTHAKMFVVISVDS